MATFKTPGVYIEEISTLAPSVAPVPTSIPGFVGYTEKAIINGQPWNFVAGATPPVRITSLLEFEAIFGGPFKESFNVTLTGISPTPTSFTIAPSSFSGALSSYILYYQLRMFYANGGGTCYISSVGVYSTGAIDDSQLQGGINNMEQIDEVTLLAAPEIVFLTQAEALATNDMMLAQCAKLQDRFALIDTLHFAGNTVQQDADTFRDDYVGPDNLKYAAAYYPALNSVINYFYENEDVTIIDLRTPPVYTGTNNKLSNILNGGTGPVVADKTLYNQITAELAKYRLKLYPCATMAGIYARVDDSRGVWQAPANVGVRFISEPSILITAQEQENLNVDSVSGKSINAIRPFTGRGNLVWGARTLAGNDNEWRYVNVRRLFLFAEESIKKATEFVVFESNTASTWSRVKGMSEAFLTRLWKDGALAGATTQEAFYVRVGLGTTMTPQDVLEGRMIVEIGMAAVRPAEFIILRFSHKLQES